MKKIEFKNLPSQDTPVNATNVNKLQDNIEEVFNGEEPMGSIVVDDISCKNKLNENGVIVNGVVGFPVDVKSGETYTISSNLPLYWFKIADDRDSPNKGAEWLGADGYTEHTFTCTESYPYVFVGINQSDPYNLPTSLSDYANYNLQIEKGDKSTPYTPYKNFEGRTNIITGQECPTNEYIDGKRVYVKKIDFGNLENNISNSLETDISNVTNKLVRWVATGYYDGENGNYNLPYFVNANTYLGCNAGLSGDNKINFGYSSVGTIWSSTRLVVDFYYTKRTTSSVSTTSLEEEVI